MLDWMVSRMCVYQGKEESRRRYFSPQLLIRPFVFYLTMTYEALAGCRQNKKSEWEMRQLTATPHARPSTRDVRDLRVVTTVVVAAPIASPICHAFGFVADNKQLAEM